MEIQRDHTDWHDHNFKSCGTEDGMPTPHPRHRDSWLCRCGKNHGKVFHKFHAGLAEYAAACTRCGGWLTDEQLKALEEKQECPFCGIAGEHSCRERI